MTAGAKRLQAYLERHNLSQAEIRKQVGVSKGYFSRVVNGLQSPGLRLAARIEYVTGIPASSWVR